MSDCWGRDTKDIKSSVSESLVSNVGVRLNESTWQTFFFLQERHHERQTSVNSPLLAFTSLPPRQPAWDHTPSRDGDGNCRRFDHTTYCNEDFKSLIPLCPIMAVVEETIMNYYHYDDTRNEICCLFGPLFGEESIKEKARNMFCRFWRRMSVSRFLVNFDIFN